MFVEFVAGPSNTGVVGAGEPVTWYPVRGLLPVTTGGDQLTVAVWEMLAKAAVTFCGADGTPGVAEGKTAFVVAEDPVPTPFVALTANVYVVLLVRPLTGVLSVEPPTTTVIPPGLETTWYDVIGSPPVVAGAVQVTVADAFPGA